MTLKELRAPAKASDPVLIFVHGILSDADACWTNKAGISWPQIVHDDPSFAGCGISTFTYKSAVTGTRFSITDAAETLWELLRDAEMAQAGKVPLFVCHSMGGIVVRRMLVMRQQDLSKAGMNLVGVFLVASPSMGSRWATWFLPLTGFMGHIQAMALSSSEKNIWLHDLRKDFRNLYDNGAIKIFGKELLEELPIALKWLPWLPPVVRAIEGAAFFADSIKVAGTDHFTVAKPADVGAFQHIALRNFAKDLRQRVSMHHVMIPAGTTFAQAMRVTCQTLQLDVDLSGLTPGERDITSVIDRQVSGSSREDLLEAVATAFPSRAIRDYRVTIRETTALPSFQ